MSADAPKTHYLKDYQPPVFLIPQVRLHFDLAHRETHVTAVMQFERNPKSDSNSDEVFLDGDKLELIEVLMDQKTIDESDYVLSDSGLLLKNCPDSFELQTKVRLEPHTNKAFSGLYQTKTSFCTQMEAQGFRRTTFFLDRPDVLSKYHVTLVADKAQYPVLLSNGNFIEQSDLDHGRHQAIWEDPFPKPCYLFALVAGDLDWIEDSFVTRTGRKVELKIYTNKGQQEKARFAMDSLKQSMKWDEETFRLEYDLDIYNIVAVDEFNMGAMENKGLNIFNSKYVLASPETATDTDYNGIQRVIGHEYFHNWTGNRVTCRDWFQLSLKEGLTVFRDQEFSGDLNSRATQRIDDVISLRSRQFPEDAGPMAHPVRPQSYIAIDNFYTVTVYEKGAEVIRMIHSLLGPDLFKKGVTKYFELYDGQAVTTDDWVYAMEQVSNRDLSLFKNWYDQAGTPQVSMGTKYDAEKKTLTLDLEQTAFNPNTGKENKPYHIPLRLGLVSKKGSSLNFTMEGQKNNLSEIVLELTEAKQQFTLGDIYEEPLVSINRGFTAPIRLNYEQTDDDLYLLMTKDPDSFNRWEAAQKLYQNALLKIYNQLNAKETPQVPEALIAAIKKTIEGGKEDPALAAYLLHLPALHYLAQFIDEIEPLHLAKAYKVFVEQVSDKISDTAKDQYTQLAQLNLGQSVNDVGVRAFKNSLLRYIDRTSPDSASQLLYQHFDSAKNMTDRLAGFSSLGRQGHSTSFDQASQSFKETWGEDFLVNLAWLSQQAMAQFPDSFARVKEVAASTDFDATNPNNLYALHRTWAENNWNGFHSSSGETYMWFADQVIDVDKRNPQVASRLGSSFNQWKSFAPVYQKGMKAALEKIKAAKPSANLFEIVSKALEKDH